MTVINERDPLVDAVTNLTQETTTLLQSYRAIKTNLESNVSQSANSAATATTKAGEASNSAALAGEKLELTTSKTVEATAQAIKAKEQADRASQITGLDTVTEAVEMALAEAYTYAMSEVEFRARQEANKLLYKGSGFVEWGNHYDGTSDGHGIVNQGITCRIHPGSENQFHLGFESHNISTGGISKTGYPIVVVNGVILKLDQICSKFHYSADILLPPAPNATKTYDLTTGVVFDFATQTDPKYGDIPSGAGAFNESVSRASEGQFKNGDFRQGTTNWGGHNGSTLTVNADGLVVKFGAGAVASFDYTPRITVPTGKTYELKVNFANLNGLTDFLVQCGGGSAAAPITYQVLEGNVLRVGLQSVPAGGSMFLVVSAKKAETSFVIGSMSFRPVTEEVITSRQDLVFLETWEEKIADKGVIYPYGNTQYGVTTLEGTLLAKGSAYGVGQSYAAFGKWDKVTEGYCSRVSTVTSDVIKQYLSNPVHNIFCNTAGELIQVRYRIRVVAGLGNKWKLSSTQNNSSIRYADYVEIAAQGLRTDSVDFHKGWTTNAGSYLGMYGASTYASNSSVGTCIASLTNSPSPGGYNGQLYYTPIALIQRLNQGAYHPVYNPEGTEKVWMNTTGNTSFWYEAAGRTYLTSTAKCFDKSELPVTGKVIGGKYGAHIGHSGAPAFGRPSTDPYQYYDAIYAGQIQDLRLSARKQDVNKLREDMMWSAVNSEMRGKGKQLFTKFKTLNSAYYSATNSTHAAFTTEANGGGSILDFYNNGFELGTPMMVWQPETGVVAYGSMSVSNGHVRFTGNKSNLRLTLHDDKFALTFSRYFKCYFAEVTELTPEYDVLPGADIIGTPVNIAAAFPNGVIGQWVAIDYSVTAQKISLNKKSNSSQYIITFTDDLGTTWNSSTFNVDPNRNETIEHTSLNTRVALLQYQTLSNQTIAANNSVVVGSVGDVFSGNYSQPVLGNRFMPSLIGKVGTALTDHLRGYTSMKSYGLEYTGELSTKAVQAPIHNTLPSPSNNSPAVKTLYTITEEDGLLYGQFHGSELHYDVTVGNWGDDSTIPIINGESTKTDDNGNTVKTFCHHTIFPLGIA